MSGIGVAFNAYRMLWPARDPALRPGTMPDELWLMGWTDGLETFGDGPISPAPGRDAEPQIPELPEQLDERRLWVIREQDVVTAPEICPFGGALSVGKVKHTNLTGGARAHAGGEMLRLDDRTLILNGGSGRYASSCEDEYMHAIKAFRDSGYFVWHMGYDREANRPQRFVPGLSPEWMP